MSSGGGWNSGGRRRRRGSQSLAAFVPTNEASLILDLDGDLGVTGTDPVTAWADQSAKVNSFGSAGGNLPSAATWSEGKGSVLFEAANAEVMAKASFAEDAANAYTISAALDLKSAGPANQYLLGVGGVGIKSHAGGAGPGIFDGLHRGAGTSVTGEQVLTWVIDPDNPGPTGDGVVSFYRNGVLLGTDDYDQTFTMAGTVYLGRFSSAVQYLDAAIARLIVINRAMSSPDLASLHTFMAGAYL